MAEMTQKSNVAEFPLRSLQKQNDWVKRSESNRKDINRICIANRRVHIR